MFQTMMNELFKELIDQHVVVVYMDDILIFTTTLEEHRRVMCRVLEILAENNLFLKLEKCVFKALEVVFGVCGTSNLGRAGGYGRHKGSRHKRTCRYQSSWWMYNPSWASSTFTVGS